jgi:hypothetical protein
MATLITWGQLLIPSHSAHYKQNIVLLASPSRTSNALGWERELFQGFSFWREFNDRIVIP